MSVCLFGTRTQTLSFCLRIVKLLGMGMGIGIKMEIGMEMEMETHSQVMTL